MGVHGVVEALAYERAKLHRDEKGERNGPGGPDPRDMAERLHYERGGEKGTVTISNSWFFGQSEGSIKVYSDGEIIPSESG